MAKQRSNGDGGLFWEESRQRWRAEVTIGYTPAGKRRTRRAYAKTKTEAKSKLKELFKDLEEGITEDRKYTVAHAVRDFLAYGLPRRSTGTVDKLTNLANTHIIPGLGARKLRELTADDVDRWLADRAKVLSTRSLREVLSLLRRSIERAQKREKVRRNVVLLCEVPEGRAGRPSKSLTLEQAEAVLRAAEGTPMRAYVVVSLLTGARTEEMRALTWSHVDLVGRPDGNPPIPPHMMVWRSVREHGDTKTRKSRRSLALPKRCVEALRAHQAKQDYMRTLARDRWQETGLVFSSAVGTELDAANVRRAFRKVVEKAGLEAKDWTPRELRHSFVSLLSDSGVPIEQISRLMGHNGTAVTELVYRHQLRPVIEHGAEAMDRIFAS
ncbi:MULTISPECIES: site-specific integrase [Amycolatopsis]|uniref:Site-specific integrase n=1 Tax=Amycolatopsis thermalba TaxID=944492 RepID=A0ABY4NML5_9PSEU|nr:MULTISPECIES: site-specific integrase [Amycolatopsis]OXM74539.1 site-specific integrase [Amycolatopsis sp. KNN50.9b]UQS21749.1 site-specific integrase [Amycolatopsis thermalba]